MKRIVSLLASSTEIVCALGFRDQLVGRSHECDYPESVKILPICTEVKIPTDGTSYEIDQRVKAIVQEGLSVYRVKSEILQRLEPDVIITQTQCEVCAVSLKDVEAAVCELVDSRPEIVLVEPNALTDIWADIQRVADALEKPERGIQLVGELKRRMEAIEKKSRSLPIPPTIIKTPTVACLEWIDPLMAAGNWMPELVEMAGGINLFGQVGRHSPYMRWEDLCEKDPEVILVLPCGWGIARARQEMGILVKRPEWSSLRAVRDGQVYLLDGNQYFNRPGPRISDSLEILAEVLHPGLFSFGHQGKGWEIFAVLPE